MRRVTVDGGIGIVVERRKMRARARAAPRGPNTPSRRDATRRPRKKINDARSGRKQIDTVGNTRREGVIYLARTRFFRRSIPPVPTGCDDRPTRNFYKVAI